MSINADRLYAHSKDGVGIDEWQSLEDHLGNVAEISSKFAGSFDSVNWGFNAGLLHDVGKAYPEFQKYIKRSNGLDDSGYDSARVNHSTAGATFTLEKYGECIGKTLSYVIAGHHAGLPDWISEDGARSALNFRINEENKQIAKIRGYIESLAEGIKEVSRPPVFVKSHNFHMWVRMLFSCLVDADYLDTEKFMDPDRAELRSPFEPFLCLKDKFDGYMRELAAKANKSQVNELRRKILESCRKTAEKPAGIFTLTVPTGGGKTLSAMAFALEHLMKHRKSRIIYVIPYTSIIEQTAGILSEIFGDDNVIEHHSNLDPEKETQRHRLASENWEAPVIVTTNVQFFESLYASKPGRCRKLHNLVNSVVILDEVQLLPPKLLKPSVKAINILVKDYRATILLATATQPALPDLEKPVEIADSPGELYQSLKRTEISFPDDLNSPVSWETVAEELKEHRQVLCVVNRRKDCYDLYRLMPEGTIHLSTLMCGRHRSRMIRYIKWRLKKGKTIRVISTQLVEAGVDIDFPVIYRAMAGFDSIAQAAGRCNREGRLNKEGRLGQVKVFIPPKPSPTGVLLKGESVAREMCAMKKDNFDDPSVYTEYFNRFYNEQNEIEKKDKDFKKMLEENLPSCSFRKAAAEFNYIENYQRPVIVRYGRKSEALIKQLRITGPKREIMRKLQRYVVNLCPRTIEEMKQNGLLEEIWDGVLVQTMPTLYDGRTGLDIYRESLPTEDLII